MTNGIQKKDHVDDDMPKNDFQHKYIEKWLKQNDT